MCILRKNVLVQLFLLSQYYHEFWKFPAINFFETFFYEKEAKAVILSLSSLSLSIWKNSLYIWWKEKG